MPQHDDLIEQAKKLGVPISSGTYKPKTEAGMSWRLPTMSYIEGSERNNAIGESIDCGSWPSFPP